MSIMPEGNHPHDTSGALAKVQHYFADRSGMAPIGQIIQVVTRAYLADLDAESAPAPAVLEQQLLGLVNNTIDAENQKAPRSNMKMKVEGHLTAWQVAQILIRVHHAVLITPGGEDTDPDYDVLAVYADQGPSRGTYVTSESRIRADARKYNNKLDTRQFKEILAAVREAAPRVERRQHRDLIAVNNGVFHYGTEPMDITIGDKEFHFDPKGLHPFDPALIFMAKCQVDYVVDAPKATITHPTDGDWEVVSWLAELFDQPGQEGMADLIWEIIGASIRPYVRWGKTAWFYSEQGNNGKGTLCALMRNFLGSRAHTSIPLANLGEDFQLEPLLNVNAVIVDENDVGTFIDKAANLKAIVTNDVIQINRKHLKPIAYQFWGLMVQCLNEFPRVKDKSESFYRRQLFVPFTKSFTGAERRYIKDDYLQRREVLEYVLWYVLHQAGSETPGSYYTFSEPPATQKVLAEYKEVNDPVRAFWDEFRERFQWDLLPFTFLYDLYKHWFHQVSPSGSPVSRNQFVTDLVAILRADTLWHCPDKHTKHRPAQMMNTPEHLIAEYDLRAWKAPNYNDPDLDRVCRPLLKPNYRGILRREPRLSKEAA